MPIMGALLPGLARTNASAASDFRRRLAVAIPKKRR